MSSEDPERTRPEDPEAGPEVQEDDGPPPTPFDHPLFLPLLCSAGAIWFGYDGFFNPEIKSILFNRIVFVGLVIAAGYFGFQAKKELDAERRDPNDPEPR